MTTLHKLETQEQVIAALLLCKEFLAESRYGHLALNANKAAKVLSVAQSDPTRFYACYKFTDEGECVGLFLGRLEELLFADSFLASEMFFYVREDHRGSPWFVKTLRDFEHWAKDRGAPQIKLSINAGINLEGTPQLFERLGYTQVGHIFDKEL